MLCLLFEKHRKTDNIVHLKQTMSCTMDKFEILTRFSETARIGSFSGAAEYLGLPKSSISQAVQSLEKTLGTRLLHRSTRRVSLTPDGEAFLPQCRALLAELEAMETQFVSNPADLRGELRVDMPSRFASNILIPKLGDFIEKHPNLRLRISSYDHRIDMIKEGIDCVIRVGDLSDSSLIARPLLRYRVVNCVSQSYAMRFGIPKTLEDLQHHKLIDYSHSLSQRAGEFEYTTVDGTHTLTMPSAIAVNGTEAYYSACLNGLGIAQLPIVGVEQEIANGRLVSVLEEFEAPTMPVNLLYPSRQQLSPRLKAFADWLVSMLNDIGPDTTNI